VTVSDTETKPGSEASQPEESQAEKLAVIIAAFLYSSGAEADQPVYVPGEVMRAVKARGKSSLKIGTNPQDPGSVIISASWENRVVLPSSLIVRG
jgi:hypothetical protein